MPETLSAAAHAIDWDRVARATINVVGAIF